MMELNEGDRSLIKTAMEATARSYSPYSHFSVGAAALLGNGTVVTGTNRENAVLSVGALCRTYYPILCQLPISRPTGCHSCHCGTNGKGLHRPSDSSCGACRQVILETEKRYKQPIRILLYGKECIYEVKV